MKCAGPDEIPYFIIKVVCKIFTPLLHNNFNLSLLGGSFFIMKASGYCDYT
jgi:hypothetical protein